MSLRTFLLALVALLAVAAGARTVIDRGHPADQGRTVCEDPTESCGDGSTVPEAVAVDEYEAATVCPSSGYLCHGPDEGERLVLRRWRGFSGTVVVHVPRPDFEESPVARELQRAAAAGIRAWNGQPFPVVVDERGSRPANFTVRWSRDLGGNVLGWAETSWSSGAGLGVTGLSLATRNPTRGSVVETRQLRLTAAHEMGHALGLGHSDNPRDLMYPSNTATAPSARDYKTLEALYGLPDGAVIVWD